MRTITRKIRESRWEIWALMTDLTLILKRNLKLKNRIHLIMQMLCHMSSLTKTSRGSTIWMLEIKWTSSWALELVQVQKLSTLKHHRVQLTSGARPLAQHYAQKTALTRPISRSYLASIEATAILQPTIHLHNLLGSNSLRTNTKPSAQQRNKTWTSPIYLPSMIKQSMVKAERIQHSRDEEAIIRAKLHRIPREELSWTTSPSATSVTTP